MPHLDRFTEDQRNLLVALPYRVGLWISSSDTSGGEEADAAELQALATIVTGFGEDFLKSEFVQRLMEETLAQQDMWPAWDHNLDEVPAECTRAVDILAEALDRKELASFKLTLMEIATAVAMAYREIEDTGDIALRMRIFIRVLMDRIQAAMAHRPARTMDELMNISESEQSAIDRLATALDLGNKRQKAQTTATQVA